jgi:tetratricopeptide (TPR) repeat protein
MSAAAGSPSASPGLTGRRWLFGPAADLVLGCGLGYAVLFAAQTLAGDAMRAWMPFALLPLLTLLISGPHYGATLLRVTQRPEDRRKYGAFTLVVTLVLGLAFFLGLRSALLGSWILTVYLTWSPWHYTGQNYGIALMFLGRRGIPITLTIKRLVYASFVASYVLLFFSFHGFSQVGDYAPATYDGSIYHFVRLGIPAKVSAVVLPLAGLVYLASVVSAGVLLLRRARLSDLLPTFLLIALQALWFTAPVVARLLGVLQGVEPLSLEHASYAFMWIAVGHAVQYLWITTFFARESGLARAHTAFLARALVVGSAVWVVPVVLFAPEVLGRLPNDMGLGVMTASIVNLHHFILDGAIWKLRDSRIARVLMRPAVEDGSESSAAARVLPRWATVAAWSAGVLALTWGLGSRVATFAFRKAVGHQDLEAAVRDLRHMGRLLVSGPADHLQVASLALGRGDLSLAREYAERGLALYPTADGWLQRAQIDALGGDWSAVAQATEAAHRLAPANVEALSLAGEAYTRLGEVERAVERLERAVLVDPGHAASHRRLGSVRLLLGDLEGAREHLARADELGDHGALANLGEVLRLQGDQRGAVETLRRSAALEELPQTLRRLAWILATTADDTLRDPPEALRLAQRLNEASHFEHPGHLETLAAAQAASGDLAAAVRWQGEALARCDPRARTEVEQRLALYRQGQSLREPPSVR